MSKSGAGFGSGNLTGLHFPRLDFARFPFLNFNSVRFLLGFHGAGKAESQRERERDGAKFHCFHGTPLDRRGHKNVAESSENESRYGPLERRFCKLAR
jgi:hypothetical protein